ncbi:MAG: type II secretion system ATPase GspE [Spirochaetia bacterium]|nr:type II secretion system ATPase GspE [Spirochaetia bacterium]
MKKQLGELLLDEGTISREELQDVLNIQKKSPLKLGQILVKKGLVTEDHIMQTLARQYGFSFQSRLQFAYDESFQAIPISLIEKARIVPVSRSGRTVTVAVHDPADLHPMDDLRSCLKEYRVEFVLAPEQEIVRVIQTGFDQAAQAAKEVMDGISEEEYGEFDAFSDTSLDLANDAPLVKMVNAILSQGVQERASDIHIEPYEKGVLVRYRIDGVLHKRLTPPKAMHAGIVTVIKVKAKLNISEQRLPQDGRIELKVAGKEVDIRVSTVPTRHGERIVMRLLNKSDVKYTIETLGLFPKMQAQVKKALEEPNGIILVTGPTGSGKSTTLYAFLNELNDGATNILTAEDPVEYEIEGVGQMQMQEKIGLTFAAALRAMLRQDPDVIMVGEMRDEETARIGIQAALTGHLVFSTLHTNDAPSAVTRLVDMGIEPYLITSTIRGVLAQRLVRVICPNCKTGYKPSEKELEDFGVKASELKGGKLYRGTGCENCANTGYRGRAGIYEFLPMDDEVRRAVLRGADSDTVKTVAAKQGMQTLLDYGRAKVVDGLTTIEEVMRVA